MTLCSRRCVVVGGLALSACGGVSSAAATGTPELDAGNAACSPEVPGPDWLQLELAAFPTLATPGGAAAVERRELLLNVWVIHQTTGCFTAVWRVCTHGACDVEPSGSELLCPCHGSRFALDGRVLRGPATRALRTFPVVRQGDTLFLKTR